MTASNQEATPSRIWTVIDFEKDGKQSGSLHLPISTDLSAYGWIPIPIVCIKNGTGPTAVLVAGNHGDEYEGQIALLELARSIEPEKINGRIIILPALNFPAVKAGRRVSPIDEGNLNRMFPGKAFGTATEMIAHYFTQVVLPMANVVLDLHSGGRSLDYLVCSLVTPSPNEARNKKLMELVHVFGAPVNFINDGKGGGGATTLAANAERLEVVTLTCELGGGATLQGKGLELARKGTRRLLKHLGIYEHESVEPAAVPPRMMVVPGRDYYLYAEADGLFEHAAEVGDEVQAGQHAGFLHSIEHPTAAPTALKFPSSGLVSSRRFPTLAHRGDCLYELVRDVTGD